MSIQQLIKKHPLTEDCRNIYPRTWIETIKDKLTDISLDEILAAFNMLYLPYIGSREDTRLQVPRFLRRKGLWITYVDYDDKIRTEWYNDNHLSDEHWQSDIHWNVVLDMSDLLNQYFGSDAFYNTFVEAVKNVIKNMDLDIEAGADEETVNNYVNSEEFNKKLEEVVNNYMQGDEIANLINQKVEQYLQNIDLSEIIKNLDFSEAIQEAVNKWFTDNTDTLVQLVTPIIQAEIDKIRKELDTVSQIKSKVRADFGFV